MAEEKDISQISLGTNLDLFRKGVLILSKLVQERNFYIYLLQEYWVKFIGNRDQFSIGITKDEGTTLSKKQTEELLEEIQVFLQVCLATKNTNLAAKLLRSNYFEEEYEEIKDREDLRKVYDGVIKEKVDLVYNSLITPALTQRQIRLSNNSSNLLEDLDIEVVKARYASGEPKDETPYLRLNFKFFNSARQGLPFLPPPWVDISPIIKVETTSFECDESEIDLIITRLTQAKSLLASALNETVKPLSENKK